MEAAPGLLLFGLLLRLRLLFGLRGRKGLFAPAGGKPLLLLGAIPARPVDAHAVILPFRLRLQGRERGGRDPALRGIGRRDLTVRLHGAIVRQDVFDREIRGFALFFLIQGNLTHFQSLCFLEWHGYRLR